MKQLISFFAVVWVWMKKYAALDMPEKIGTIEKGKYADIIAVEGNPLKNIDCPFEELRSAKIQ
mgnify:CR=1 FL=1